MNLSQQLSSLVRDDVFVLFNISCYIGEDGRPYCAKCHSPLLTKDIIPGRFKRMPTPCECAKAKYEKQIANEERANKEMLTKRLRIASLIGERYENVTFDSTHITSTSFKVAFDRCRNYCKISAETLSKGYGMYIFGEPGVGKTHLTACMCNELIAQYKQCLFTNFFEIAKLIRSSYNHNIDSEQAIRDLCSIDFLFIDDMGTERLKTAGEDNWMQEQVYEIINARYNNNRPTIFTSNNSLNELITKRGMWEKTVDRIIEMSTAIIKIDGQSIRNKNAPSHAPF